MIAKSILGGKSKGKIVTGNAGDVGRAHTS